MATYRDAQDEIAALRHDLAEANLLADELGKALNREHAIEKQHLSDLVDARHELERLRDAIRHVDDLYQQGNTLGFIADAARLGRLLDEQAGGAG